MTMSLVEPIIFTVFLSSFLGVFLIVRQKIPFLYSYLKDIKNDEEGKSLLSLFKEKAVKRTVESLKGLPFIKKFSFELLLKKILFKIKIFALKTENKISFWLAELRKRSEQRQSSYNDDRYWKELGGEIQKKVSQLKNRAKKEKKRKRKPANR
jgi:hypothetical protein